MSVVVRAVSALRAFFGFLCALALGVALPAQADEASPPALVAEPEPDGADALVRAAVTAYAAGDLGRARALFEEAHFTHPTARTFRGLGVLAYREQRWVDAVVLLEQSLASTDRPLGPELREGVQTLIAESERAIARVTLNVAPAGAAARCDGEPCARDVGQALLLLPGEHRLEVAAAGYATRALSVTTHAAETLALDVSLPALAELPGAGAAVAPPKAAVEPAARSARSRRLRVAGRTLLALTAGFVVASVITGALGVARLHDVEDHCRAQLAGVCSAADVRAKTDDAQLSLLAALTNVGIAGAGVSAAAGLGAWLFARREAHAPGARAVLAVRYAF